jgi:hypothetical protein
MTRNRNEAVTQFAILLPASHDEATGEATFETELGVPTPVRLFSSADRQLMARKLRGAEGDHLFALLALRDALESKDAIALERAKDRLEKVRSAYEKKHPFQFTGNDAEKTQFANLIASFVGLSPEESLRHLEGRRPGPRAMLDPRRLLSYEVTQQLGMANVSLALWWNNGQMRPAIFCRNLRAAYYIHTFFVAPAGEIGWRVCPYCTEPFFQTRPNQDYCRPTHRDAHRVARWRDEKKKRLVTETGKTGRKNVTQKAR